MPRRLSCSRRSRLRWSLHYECCCEVDVLGHCCGCDFHRHLLLHGETLMPIISVRDLVVEYDGRRVLNGLNLDIEHGETMVLLGGSGCGKSTLLRQIIGLEKPKSGSVFVKEVDITRCSKPELEDTQIDRSCLPKCRVVQLTKYR